MARWSSVISGGAGAFGLWALRRARRSRAFSWRDKVVLITGGSRGLGLVLARQLLERGARVCICGRDQESLDRAAEQLRHYGTQVLHRVCDVRHRDEVERWVAGCVEVFGRVDALINNAGTMSFGPADEMTLEDHEDALDTHYWGPLFASLAVIPHLRERRGGRIVNIASIGARLAVPHLLPYSGSKFALAGLSEGLRAEYARDGILVTTVFPGLMRTGSPRNAWFKGQHRREYAWFILSDSLPGLSMSAETAARKILSAAARGQPDLVIGLPAKLGVLAHGIAPGLTQRLLGRVAGWLPEPGGIGPDRIQGKESETRASRNVFTLLTRRAEVRNNERGADEPISTGPLA